MFRNLRVAITLFFAMTVIVGVVYPSIVTAIAQAFFSYRAGGSLIQVGDKSVGSELIGQLFTKPEYFWGRLSATEPFPYNAAASSGSNYGPMNPALKDAAETRINSLRQHGALAASIPVDLVTASASGLDPHISPAAAEFQVPRVAAARMMAEDTVREFVRQHTEGRQFGMLGEPRVNVLRLNLALDQHQKMQ